MKRVRYSWIVPQWLASSWLTSISTASRLGRIGGRLGPDLPVEGVGEAVGGVGGDDERAVAELRRADGGGGGEARLAHPALARVEDEPRAHRRRPPSPAGRGRAGRRRRARRTRRGRAGRGRPARARARGRAARACPPRAGPPPAARRGPAPAARAASRRAGRRAPGATSARPAGAASAPRGRGRCARGSRRTPTKGIPFSVSRRWK